MAEALLNQIGMGRFRASSAGSQPNGTIHPRALETLAAARIRSDGLRSKSWNEFSGSDAPEFDFVFTLCDSAAEEACPVWHGHPMTAHWGFPDPAAVEGTDAEINAAFYEVFRQIRSRLEAFVNLPFDRFDRLALQGKLREMGEATRTVDAD